MNDHGPLQTLALVQDMQQRRFATLQIGAGAVATVREEFTLLRRVAALACGVPVPEALTRADLEAFLLRVDVQRAGIALDPAGHADVRALLAVVGDAAFIALLLALVSEAAAAPEAPIES